MPRVERMEIDLALAIEMTNAAKAKAVEINAPMSIAVLDAGANLLSFQRMDGAELAGPNLAVDKAYTSVTNRIETGELRSRVAPDGDLPSMSAKWQWTLHRICWWHSMLGWRTRSWCHRSKWWLMGRRPDLCRSRN